MKRLLRSVEDKILGPEYYSRHYEHYHPILRDLIVPYCKTVLDVGCGGNSPVQAFNSSVYSVGVDSHEPSLRKSQEMSIHDEYRTGDIRCLLDLFEPRSYDCVLASDVIEHLEKEDGYELIRQMEQIARKRVIVMTPNGWQKQEATPDNLAQSHLSGWTASEMRRLGYNVIGVHGIKWFRRGQAQLRSPKAVFMRLSILSQGWITHFPRLAYQILCFKDMSGDEHS